MVKAVIFDLDGTLIDTIDTLADASNYALTKMGCPTWSVADYRTFVGNGITRLLLRSLPEERKSEIDTARSHFNEYYSEHLLDKVSVYEGIPQLISALKERGIRMAVNTNKAGNFAVRLMESAFPNEFEKVVGDEGGYPRKPEPDAALALSAMMEAKPYECMFVGDSGVDLATAKNAGMISVLCSWGFVFKSVLEEMDYEYIIDSPMELLNLIDKK